MISGYNQNLTHRNLVFHVQTEDAGPRARVITTTLFHGGAVVECIRTAYPDVPTDSDLPATIRDLMIRQHRAVMEQLRSGQFDDRLVPLRMESKTVRP